MNPSLRIVLTGPPRCGKTTIIKKACGLLKERVRLVGFYTEEIGDAGRSGFQLVTFDGIRIPFAHVDLKRGPRVGPYKVDLPAFEAAVIPQLQSARRQTLDRLQLCVIDEVGKMECMSAAFAAEVEKLLEQPICLLMTVSFKGSGLMVKVRQLAGEDLIQVTESNRDMLPAIIVESIVSQYALPH